MNARRLFPGLVLSFLCLVTASPALGLANRVFVSARSGNDANLCDDVNAPCKTFAGAVTKLNPNGEVIVLDSGGYGPVTITQGITIEAPAGVTAFIHPPSGDAIAINAGTGTVTLRGLVLNVGSVGIKVNSVGTLNVENCFIAGFSNGGIQMLTAGRLNLKGTAINNCLTALGVANTAGLVQASVDHCHLDGNEFGYRAATTSSGSSTATATYTTANNNTGSGWICGAGGSSGKDSLTLEFCTGSENTFDGLVGNSSNAQSAARYSNCVFAHNGNYGVERLNVGTVETRGNNTITGNVLGTTNGAIGSFLPL